MIAWIYLVVSAVLLSAFATCEQGRTGAFSVSKLVVIDRFFRKLLSHLLHRLTCHLLQQFKIKLNYFGVKKFVCFLSQNEWFLYLNPLKNANLTVNFDLKISRVLKAF